MGYLALTFPTATTHLRCKVLENGFFLFCLFKRNSFADDNCAEGPDAQAKHVFKQPLNYYVNCLSFLQNLTDIDKLTRKLDKTLFSIIHSPASRFSSCKSNTFPLSVLCCKKRWNNTYSLASRRACCVVPGFSSYNLKTTHTSF